MTAIEPFDAAAVLELLPDAVVIAAADAGLLYANPAARELFELAAGDLPPDALGGWKFRTEAGAIIDSVLNPPLPDGDALLPPRAIELTRAGTVAPAPAGEGEPVRWLRARSRAVPHGGATATMTVFTEITAQHSRDAAGIQADRRLRMLAENASDIVLLSSASGLLEWISPSITAILGWQPEELIGKSAELFVHPEDRAQRSSQVPELLAGGAVQMPMRLLSRDGSHRWFSVMGKAIYDDAGRVIGRVSGGRDVQAEMESRAALLASEEQFRLLTESSSDVVLHLRDGIMAWVSPSMREVLGWTAAALVGTASAPLLHPDDVSVIRAACDEVAKGKPQRARFRFQRSDGSYIWVHGTARQYLDASGNPDGMVLSMRDISPEVAAEIALGESNEHFRMLAENATDLVWQLDLNNTISWVSPSVVRVLGWTPEDVLGINPMTLMHPDEVNSERAKIRRETMYEVDQVPMFETRLRTKSGQYRYLSVQARPTRDGNQITGMTVGLRDVHDEVIAREALARSEQQFRLVLEGAPIGMAITSVDGRILRVNRALCEILGYSRDELTSMTLADISDPDDMVEHSRQRQALLSGETQSYQMEKRHFHRNGQTVWTQLSGSLIRDGEGEPLTYVSQIQDITAEKHLIDQLNRSNEDLRRFAYVASHDLQAPLRTVGGFTQVLLASMDSSQITEEQLAMATAITDGVTKMHQLIRDLLAYARVDSESRRSERVSIAGAHDDVLALIARDIAESGATLSCTSEHVVEADPTQVRQVLQNLITNALVHRSPERLPVVTTSSRLLPNGLVEISVADNGVGISAEHHDRVFEIFKQLKKGQGTGIGLAIVERIVERHGGTITVESDGTSGSTFRFTLPRA